MEPFVTSAKKNCPSAEIVLFVDDISDFTRERLMTWGGACIENISAEYKNVLIIHTRWKMCANFLEQYGTNYEQALIVDTRDVIFQGDVFATFKSHKNYLGYTTERQLIGEDKVFNYRWIEDCFGKAEADKLADKKAICCGTVIGTSNEMKIFCSIMWDNLKAKVIWGHEQAMINYLVYKNLLPIENMIEIDTYSGTIFTNGILKENKIRDDKILRGDGGVPAVVHQYDRHKELIQFVDSVYRDKNFQVDKRFMDTRSVLEQVSCLLYANKIGEALQFCMRNFSAELNRGENVNSLLRLWEFVLQKPLTPAVGFIELTIQAALKFAPKISPKQLNKICSLLIYSAQNNRGVEFGFKIFIMNLLLSVVVTLSNEGNTKLCSRFMDVIKLLNI